METKTCPHCSETAEREVAWDINFSLTLKAWVCVSCGRTFYTHPGKEELLDESTV
jgi:transposase-like protein